MKKLTSIIFTLAIAISILGSILVKPIVAQAVTPIGSFFSNSVLAEQMTQEAIAKVNSGTFTISDLSQAGAIGIDVINLNSYKLAIMVEKELKDGGILDILDINYSIAAANTVTYSMRGDVIIGGYEDGIWADDAYAVKKFISRTGKTTLTLNQVIRADYNNNGIVNVTDVTNILIRASRNCISQ